jgi:outer membrane protein assembly factor BamB
VQYLVAFDKRTGKIVWKKQRSIDYGTDNGDLKKAYSTPSVITVDGKRQLISPAAVETVAYDPGTGNELWRVRHGGMNAACRPLFGHGLVYLSAGDGPLSIVAVRPDGTGDVTNTHVAWASGQSIPKRSSQIILGDLLFMTADNGVATCRDAKTGRLHWQQRHPGEYWASPVGADGKIYFFSKEGQIPVVRASSDYELLAMNSLDSGINSSPAIVGRAVYVRTFSHLYRIEQE